jgi:hypothetical protein
VRARGALRRHAADVRRSRPPAPHDRNAASRDIRSGSRCHVRSHVTNSASRTASPLERLAAARARMQQSVIDGAVRGR